MPPAFAATALAHANLPQALPLLRATWPALDLAAWLGFAAGFLALAGSRGTITALFDSQGGLCGLFASRVEQKLIGGRILGIPLFTAIDVGNTAGPVRALLDAATAEMKKNGCGGLQIQLMIEQSELTKRLHALGFAPAATLHSIAEMADPIG